MLVPQWPHRRRVTIPVTLTVTPRVGYDTAALDTEIRRRLSVFFGDIEDPELPITPLGVGKDVVVAQIVGIVMAVPGVYSVEVEEPADDGSEKQFMHRNLLRFVYGWSVGLTPPRIMWCKGAPLRHPPVHFIPHPDWVCDVAQHYQLLHITR